MTIARRAIIFNDTRVDHHHGCTTVMETIMRLCASSGIEIQRYVPARTQWRDNPELHDAMAKADLVIVNGEGTIHHNRPAGRDLLEIASVARERACSTALINATWAENSPKFARLASQFDLISVRETTSQAELADQGVTARVIPDLALYAHTPTGERHGIAVTDNVIASTSVALHKQMTQLGAQPISLLYGRRSPIEVARNLRRYQLDPQARQHGWRAIFGAAFDDWRMQSDDRDGFLRTLAGSELIITGRFHAMVLSLGAQTPVIAVPSNTHKNAATLRDAGLEPWRAPARVEDIDSELIDRAQRWTPAEADALADWLERSRQAMETLFAEIANLPIPVSVR